MTVIASISSSGEARASNLGSDERNRTRDGRRVSSHPNYVVHSGISVYYGVVSKSTSSPERCQFHSLITGIFVVEPDMFYNFSLDPYVRGLSGVQALCTLQKMLSPISNRLQNLGRKDARISNLE